MKTARCAASRSVCLWKLILDFSLECFTIASGKKNLTEAAVILIAYVYYMRRGCLLPNHYKCKGNKSFKYNPYVVVTMTTIIISGKICITRKQIKKFPLWKLNSISSIGKRKLVEVSVLNVSKYCS